MTANVSPEPTRHAADRARAALADPQLGPLATFTGQCFTVGALVQGFGVLYERLPAAFSLVLLAPVLACLAMAPRRSLRRLRLSVPLGLLVAWLTASWTWSVGPDQTWFALWTSVLLVVGMAVVAELLSSDALARAVGWSVRLTLLLVVGAVLTSSSARISGSSDFVVVGWRGTFVDKNSMAIYLVFALAATLTLDRGRSRLATSVVIGGLLVGSQSATGLSAALLVVVSWIWLSVLRRRSGRRSAVFVLSTLGAALTAFAAVLFNYTAILEVYGKDASLTGRTDIWAAVVGAIAREPLTGYGAGALLNSAAPSSSTLKLWQEIGFDAAHAHNGVLDLLGQLGGIGLLLYVAAIWTTARAATARLRQAPGAAMFALVTLSAQLLMSVAENVFLGVWVVVLVILHSLVQREAADELAPLTIGRPDRRRARQRQPATAPSRRLQPL